MADRFETLIQDLERVRAQGRTFGVFGEEGHDYALHPPLLEEEVAAFEAEHGIRLPADYREFLIRVGNGGAGPYYGLFKLGEMDDGFEHGPWGDFVGRLASPFPHMEPWNDLTGEPGDPEEISEEQYEARLEAFERRYYDARLMDGAIPICHLGCALRQWLVVTGSEAGHVWCDDRVDRKGLSPLQSVKGSAERKTFFQWYRGWLDGVLNKVWKQCAPREKGARHIDEIMARVTKLLPSVRVLQHTVNNPNDDDGLWWFSVPQPDGTEGDSIHVESSWGMCPFLIETNEQCCGEGALRASTVDEAVRLIVEYLHAKAEGRAVRLSGELYW